MLRILRHIAVCLLVVLISRPAKADIEPINIVVKQAVASVEEVKKQYLDVKEKYNKVKSAITTGRDKIKQAIDKVKEIKENPLGALKTFIPKGMKSKGPSETGFERIENTQKTYSRTEGMFDNIAYQKELNSKLNQEKFQNISVLFARSIARRQVLKKEESKEPDLSTLAAAQKAASDSFIKSSRRWSSILQTKAYVKSFGYTIEIQNYLNEDEEGKDE